MIIITRSELDGRGGERGKPCQTKGKEKAPASEGGRYVSRIKKGTRGVRPGRKGIMSESVRLWLGFRRG
jgi:hypothetical protein